MHPRKRSARGTPTPRGLYLELPAAPDQQLDELLNFVLEHFGGKQRHFLEIAVRLSRTTRSAKLGPEQIRSADPSRAWTDASIQSLATRVRSRLNGSFFENEGRSQRLRLIMNDAGYRVLYGPNRPKPQPNDLVRMLWEPHLGHGRPSRIVYPEPLFLRDERHTYYRNPDVAKLDERGLLGIPASTRLIKSYSFVPSGVVMAIGFIFGYFQAQGVPVAMSPVRPESDLPDEGHLIIVGSAATMPQLRSLEAPLRFQISHRGYSHGDEQHRDTNDGDDMTGTVHRSVRHAILTRRRLGPTDRFATVISGSHGRCVEAVARCLFEPAHVEELAKLLGGRSFPRCFQVALEISMTKTEGEPSIDDVHAVAAVRLDC